MGSEESKNDFIPVQLLGTTEFPGLTRAFVAQRVTSS